MDGMEFYRNVGAHADLEWLGCRREKRSGPSSVSSVADAVAIRCSGAVFAVPLADVLGREWEELEGVLTGKRPARVVTHMTRIVGYYSATKDWNRSKLAELRDRGRGEYGVPARTPARAVQDGAAPEGLRA